MYLCAIVIIGITNLPCKFIDDVCTYDGKAGDLMYILHKKNEYMKSYAPNRREGPPVYHFR